MYKKYKEMKTNSEHKIQETDIVGKTEKGVHLCRRGRGLSTVLVTSVLSWVTGK